LKFILNNWRMVKIGTTQNQRKLFFNLGKERRRMIEEGEEPDARVLADRMGVREKDVEEMSLRLAHRDVYLDAPMDDGFYPDAYLSEAGSDPGAEETLSDDERRGLLLEKIAEFRDTISGREGDIFDRRLMTDAPETLKTVGETWSISRERVRQIQNRLLDNVADWLRRELPEFDETFHDMAG
jgi:RNA polymerase sigma-32 factor